MIGKRVILSFEGAEQAIYVWINGEFVGYAEDSFTVSEFDITPYVKETGNRLCVEVHKRSTAAFLEDQDFFRFFGLFRDVNLYGLPDIHVSDLWIHPKCALDGRQASMEIEFKTTKGKTASYADARAEICLLDGHQMIAKRRSFRIRKFQSGSYDQTNLYNSGIVTIRSCIRWKSESLTDRGPHRDHSLSGGISNDLH